MESREYKPPKPIYNKQWNWNSNKKPLSQEKPRTRWIQYWILQGFKELIPKLLKLLHKNEKEKNALKLIQWDYITLVATLNKNKTKKKIIDQLLWWK
jgi:hypothetical protein